MEVIPEEARRYVDLVFNPQDIFEVRVKYGDDGYVSSFYITPNKREQFFDLHMSIHDSRKGNVWIGVGPRDKVGSTHPKLNRVLWCDFDATVNDEAKLEEVLAASPLPPPTMVVNSGHGYHAYWKLTEAVEPEVARAYSKGVHQSLPTDATHDPTRVMRLPGSNNYKDLSNPAPCTIWAYHPDRVYDIEIFPSVDTVITDRIEERVVKVLDYDTLTQLLSVYVDGQKHRAAVGITGYLRKDRFFSRAECMDAMEQLHRGAGVPWPDPNIEKVVNDTYDMPISQIAGKSVLYELGVMPPDDNSVKVVFKVPTPPAIGIVDFTVPQEEQEFWMKGLVGPGLTTLWAAAPKTGKSFAVMQLGYHLAKGEDLWGFSIPKAKRVLYFQGELSQGMVYSRAVGLFGRNNIPSASIYAMTDRPRETLTLTDHPEVLMDIAGNYDVIIIDPLSAFNGNDENSYTSVRATLSIFDSLKAQGKAVILVHHTRKSSGGSQSTPTADDARGSGLWVSAADSIVMQQKVDSTHSRLHFTLRAAPDIEPLLLYRMDNGGFTCDRMEYLRESSHPGLNLDMMN